MQDATEQDTAAALPEFDFIQPSSKYLDIDGEKLRAARVKVCPKQEAFACACNWSKQYQCQLEAAGVWSVPIETANKIKMAIMYFANH
jgi:hypothetical protein